MNQPTEVLVIGAGPTGLALACHLLRLGVRVRIVEKKTGPSTTSKAIGLQYRVSEILACMGVADRFLARGSSPTAVNIQVGDRRLVQLRFIASGTESGRDAFAPRAIMIPQSETEEILAICCASVAATSNGVLSSPSSSKTAAEWCRTYGTQTAKLKKSPRSGW